MFVRQGEAARTGVVNGKEHMLQEAQPVLLIHWDQAWRWCIAWSKIAMGKTEFAWLFASSNIYRLLSIVDTALQPPRRDQYCTE